MKVLMITSEAVPFAKSGGLGDVVGSLSEHLTSLGIDVRVLMPRYSFIPLEPLQKNLFDIDVPIGFDDIPACIHEGRFPDGATPVYFLEHSMFASTDHIYGHHDQPYHNNALRFSLLSRAAFDLCKRLNWYPDILHSHDWPAGLVPAFLHTFEQKNGFQHTRTVHSIHNLGYQGVFSLHDIHTTRLTLNELYNGEHSERSLNFLLSALLHSDRITTVSPNYAREIQTEEHGFGLHEVLKQRSGVLSGILNGIDYDVWNPETDPALSVPFSEDTLDRKEQNKAALTAECGFQYPDRPLFAMISRLVEQKGFRDLFKVIDAILEKEPLNMVILGTGESWAQEKIAELDTAYSNFKGVIGFDEELAHRIEASSDFFLMPSRYEPCGLNQLFSLRYGTIPVVTPTGGLSDTVIPLRNADATGILIDGSGGGPIHTAVTEAINLYTQRPEELKAVRIRGMKQRFTWDRSAQEYIDLYRDLIGGPVSP